MLRADRKENVKDWQAPSDLSEVRKISDQVISFFKPLGLSEGVCFDLRLCFEEALINAMKYGNQLKRENLVDVQAGYNEKKVWLRIEDSGKGFDVSKASDCTSQENLLKESGRGIYLIHQLMDEVKYNSRGNCILMVKSIQGPR